MFPSDRAAQIAVSHIAAALQYDHTFESVLLVAFSADAASMLTRAVTAVMTEDK
jgi:hypothetical protein